MRNLPGLLPPLLKSRALKCYRPTAAAKWTIGTSGNNIGWSITGAIANVKIDYSKDGGSDGYGYNIIASRDASQNPYPWTIPLDQNILSTSEAKIRVSDASYGVVYGASPNFMIKSGISVTAPDTNTISKIGDPFSIAWTTLGTANMGNVNIYFSKSAARPGAQPLPLFFTMLRLTRDLACPLTQSPITSRPPR